MYIYIHVIICIIVVSLVAVVVAVGFLFISLQTNWTTTHVANVNILARQVSMTEIKLPLILNQPNVAVKFYDFAIIY